MSADLIPSSPISPGLGGQEEVQGHAEAGPKSRAHEASPFVGRVNREPRR
jgi:hypothetical protein